MSDDVDDKLSGTAKRLLISVPDPLARINLGAPWQGYVPKGTYETDGVAKFGYPGVSIQAAGNLFFDANKFALFQTSLSYMGQVGGQWLQYSNSHQFIASRANATVAVDDKLLLATGAGHGQITSLDHGKRLRMVPYNNLNLHYRVEEIQNGLSEFFTGRVTRETPWPGKRLALFKYAKGGEYDRSKAALTPGEGFWDVLDRAAGLLGNGLPAYRGAHGLFPRTAGAKYGYSGYFARFDPYAKKEPKGLMKPFIWFRNLLADLRRFADVVAKLGEAITNLPLIRHAFTLVDAVENMVLALEAGMRVAGTLGAGPKIGEGLAFDKQVLDELDSALLARFAGADATYGSRKAKLSTGDGPWTVPAGGYVELRTSPTGSWTKSRIIPGQAPELIATSGLGPVPVTARTSTITLAPAALSRSTSVPTDAPDVTALVTSLNQLTGMHVLLDASAAIFGTVTDSSGAKRLKLDALPLLATGLVVRSTTPAVLLGLGLIDEAEALSGTASVTLAAPFEAPSPIAQDLLGVGRSVTVELVREARTATISWDVSATASAATIVAAINAAAEGAALVPAGGALADTSGIALRLTPPLDTTFTFTSTGDAAARLGFADTSSQPAAVTGSGPLTEGWGANPWIVVKTDAGEARLALGPHNAAGLTALADAINATMGSTVASDAGGKLKLESAARGSGAFVELRADSARTFILLGFAAPDVPVMRQDGEDVAMTAAELKQLLEQGPFGQGSSTVAQVKVTHRSSSSEPTADYLELESTEALSGDVKSYLEARGPLATLLSGTKDEVKDADEAFQDSLTKFHAVWFELNKLPEDTRNILRPVSHLMNDVVDSLNKTDQALEGATGAVLGSRFIPGGPPTALGLISKEGITLGTPEKIVGAAGKGFYFVADGGTGQRDVKKFVERGFMGLPIERLISNFMSNAATGIGDLLFPPEADAPPAKEDHAGGGFHVISNSSASLVSRTSVDLLAIGSEKKGATVEGAGIARLAATHSVEVAGHRSVRIAATGSSSKAAKVTELTPDKKGGLVEVLGSRLVLGATSGANWSRNVPHKIDWPLNTTKKLAFHGEERTVASPTETIALTALESTKVTVAPYTLTMKTDGVHIGGPSAGSQTATQEYTQEINDAYDAADAATQALLVKEQAGIVTANLNALTCQVQPLVQGRDEAAWRGLAKSHRAAADQLQQTLQASLANRAVDINAATQTFANMKYSPALVFGDDEIVLGFKVDAGPVSKWGPRIHIKPDQLLVAMGATGTQPDAQHASLLLKAKQVEITPTAGQVKLKVSAQGAKIQAGAQSFVEWTAAGTSGANVKKI